MLSEYHYTQMLLNYMPISESASRGEVDVSYAINILEGVKREISMYVRELAKKTDKSCEFYMLYPEISLTVPGVEDNGFFGEMIHLPFLSCIVCLWERMKQDASNPVFQVLKHFCMNVQSIRCILAMYGVSYKTVLTGKLLMEYHIEDTFELHPFENIFSDVMKYISEGYPSCVTSVRGWHR